MVLMDRSHTLLRKSVAGKVVQVFQSASVWQQLVVTMFQQDVKMSQDVNRLRTVLQDQAGHNVLCLSVLFVTPKKVCVTMVQGLCRTCCVLFVTSKKVCVAMVQGLWVAGVLVVQVVAEEAVVARVATHARSPASSSAQVSAKAMGTGEASVGGTSSVRSCQGAMQVSKVACLAAVA